MKLSNFDVNSWARMPLNPDNPHTFSNNSAKTLAVEVRESRVRIQELEDTLQKIKDVVENV